MIKRLKKISVIFLATILTFSTNIAAFAADASSELAVGTYGAFTSMGTVYKPNIEYCYAKVESSFLVSIEIEGCGKNAHGRFDFSRYIDQDYGLITGAHSVLGFEYVSATFSVWSDDGYNCVTYDVWD